MGCLSAKYLSIGGHRIRTQNGHKKGAKLKFWERAQASQAEPDQASKTRQASAGLLPGPSPGIFPLS